MKHLAIIGTAGIPAKYGGFETLTEQLTRRITNRYNTSVYCSGQMYNKQKRKKKHNGARLIYLPLKANGVQSIIYDIISIIHALFVADILLILGVSGCIILPFIRLFSNKPIIINIDGLEWKREKWNHLASSFLKFSERIAIKHANEIITDNRAIQQYVMKEYSIESNLIEYGADHVKLNPATPNKTTKTELLFHFINKASDKYSFSVCRIEPENNIHLILKAFRTMPNQYLLIVGNWLHSEYSKNLYKKYKNCPNIYLSNPIYEQNTLDYFRKRANIYIHGHSAGGTNPSLVEAMYLGLPVIAFNVSYNRETSLNQAYYFHDTKSLKLSVKILNTSPIADKIALRLGRIAYEKYTWETISNKYTNLFEAQSAIEYNKENTVLIS